MKKVNTTISPDSLQELAATAAKPNAKKRTKRVTQTQESKTEGAQLNDEHTITKTVTEKKKSLPPKAVKEKNKKEPAQPTKSVDKAVKNSKTIGNKSKTTKPKAGVRAEQGARVQPASQDQTREASKSNMPTNSIPEFNFNQNIKEELGKVGEQAGKLIDYVAQKMGTDRHKVVTALKEEGAQVLSSIVADAMANPKFRTLTDITVKDIQTLIKRHSLEKAINVGRKMVSEKVNGVLKGNTKDKSLNERENLSLINEKTDTLQLLKYVVDNPQYKGVKATSNIVSFLSLQSVKEDIVVGHATKWVTLLQQAKLFEQSSLDAVSINRMNVELVKSLFSDQGHIIKAYKEHLGYQEPSSTNRAKP